MSSKPEVGYGLIKRFLSHLYIKYNYFIMKRGGGQDIEIDASHNVKYISHSLEFKCNYNYNLSWIVAGNKMLLSI